MHDVSIDEINDLIKSGELDLLGAVPFISPNILQEYNYDSDAIGNHRVDLLSQVENNIDFQKSIGGDTARLDSVLENMKKIDGTYFPQKVDINV